MAIELYEELARRVKLLLTFSFLLEGHPQGCIFLLSLPFRVVHSAATGGEKMSLGWELCCCSK